MIRTQAYGDVTRFDLARTLAGKGRYWTTAYLVDGLLIDSGCAHTAAELGLELKDSVVHCIANTHSHEDHIGGNGPLQRQHPGVSIAAHPLALPVLADPRGKQPLHPYRKIFWGWPEPSTARPLADGETIQTEHYTFIVVYTPGHSADHFCLFEPSQGWLFSGDLFVGGKDRAIRAGYDVWEIIRSLKKMAELPVSVLFPGSARVRREPKQALSDKIKYLEFLGEQVQELAERNWPARRIASHLFGRPMYIELVTLGHFSRRCLVLSFLGANPDPSLKM